MKNIRNTRLINLVYNRGSNQILLSTSNSDLSFPVFVPFPINNEFLDPNYTSTLSDLYKLNLQFYSLIDITNNNGVIYLCNLYLAENKGTVDSLKLNDLLWDSVDRPKHDKLNVFSRQLLDTAKKVIRSGDMSYRLSESLSSFNKKAISFIDQKTIVEESASGWSQYFSPNSIGALSSAQGILCYMHSQHYEHSIPTLIDTIYELQNEDGGWPVKTALIGKSNISITESTLYVMWALISTRTKSSNTFLSKALNWLKSNQTKNGSWCSSSYSSNERVYTTSFAIRVLSEVAPASNSIKLAASWLKAAKNEDGGWGVGSHIQNNSDSQAVYTAHALLALLAVGTDKNDDLIKEGVKYLLNVYSIDMEQGWESVSEVEYVDKDGALDFKHFATPWCIKALLDSGVEIDNPILFEACYRLANSQHASGFWSCRIVSGQAPIWATHDALYALNTLIRVTRKNLDVIYTAADTKRENNLSKKSILMMFENKPEQSKDKRIAWIITWNIVITMLIIALILFNPDINSILSSSSNIVKTISTIGVAFVAGIMPFLYNVLLEEYKLWRKKDVVK